MNARKKLLIAACLSVSGIAQAGPLVPVWDFATRTGFIDGSVTLPWTCEGGADNTDTCSMGFHRSMGSELGFGDLYRTVSWGSESNPWDSQSFLNVTGTDPADIDNWYGYDYNHDGDFDDLGESTLGSIGDSIITNGGWFNINAFEHFNNVITTAGGNLGTINIFGSFALTGPAAIGFPPPFGTGVNFVMFDETLNQQVCPGLNPNGTYCDDLFLTAALAGSTDFSHDGRNYRLSFRFLPGTGASVVDMGGGIVGIYTSEPCSADGVQGCQGSEATVAGYRSGYSLIFTQARIDEIPEPAAAGLLGLGLLLLALRRRRVG